MPKPLSKRICAVNPSATLAIDSKFKQMKAEGIDVVGFGAGEPDFDTPTYIKNAAIEALNAGKTKYTPASGIVDLKKAVCKKLKEENGLSYEPSQIIISNGAKHSLFNALSTLLNEGDEVILPAPYWVSYYELIKVAGGVPVIITAGEDQHFKITADQLEKAITPRTKAFILNSPCNPTGMVYNRDELKAIAEVLLRHDLYVIADEIYEKLVYDGVEQVSIGAVDLRLMDNMIVINGVSKTYAMTGWRIGYSASSKEIAKAMSSFQSHATSNPNTIAQYAALAALSQPSDDIAIMHEAFRARRDFMVERINRIDGVSAILPHGAFYVMMNVSKLYGREFYGTVVNNCDQLCEKLLEVAGVAFVPCTAFGAPDYVRLSYATSTENIEEGLNRLEKFLQGYYKEKAV